MDNYEFTLYESANGFSYNGNTYAPGSSFSTSDACEMKGFINAYQAANPDSGINEQTEGSINSLNEACAAQPNNVTPQPAPPTPPSNQNPGQTGDTADQQAAPTPPVSGTMGQNTTTADDPPPTQEPTRPDPGQPTPDVSSERSQNPEAGGDPVDLFSGSFTLYETDLVIPHSLMGFEFRRSYRSGIAVFGPFGWNWDHNYNSYVRELSTGDLAVWRNLQEHIFTNTGAGYEPPRGIFEQVKKISDHVFEISEKGGSTIRYERPPGWIDGERVPAIWINDRHGNSITFTYGAEDKLTQVADDDGRHFLFSYDECGLIVSVEDHTGRKVEYGHNEETMHLNCVKSPDTKDFPEGIYRYYHYENPWEPVKLRHNIVRITDDEGRTYVENTYEKDPSSWRFARVIEQLYAGHLYQFDYTPLQWVPYNPIYTNIPALRVEVMDPNFNLQTYTMNYRGDLLDRRYRLSKDKSFRVVVWQYEYDDQGNLSVLIKPDGSKEINTFDFGHPDPRMRSNLLQKELTSAIGFPAPSRIVWQGKYDDDYQLLLEEKDEDLNTTTYKYDFELTPADPSNSGKLLEIQLPETTLPDGTKQNAKVKYAYNSLGQMKEVELPDGSVTAYTFSTIGDTKNRIIEEIHDKNHLAISLGYKYDPHGYISERIDAKGHVTSYAINKLGDIESTTLPQIGASSTTYSLSYNSDQRIISQKRPAGSFTHPGFVDDFIEDIFERDVLGHPQKYILSANTNESKEIKVCCDYRGLPIQTTNPDGSKINRKYDERGLLLEEEIVGVDGQSMLSKRIYDTTGKVLKTIDFNGCETVFEYDGFSRLTKEKLPNGTVIKNSWIDLDLLDAVEITGDDGQGNVRVLSRVEYQYDEQQRRIKETTKSFESDLTSAVDLSTEYFYTEEGRLVKSVDHRGGEIQYQYDTLGRNTSIIDQAGNEQRFVYDDNNNIITKLLHSVEQDGTVTIVKKEYAYDARNRLIEIIEPDGTISSVDIDDRDLVILQSTPLGINHKNIYDSFGRKKEQILDEAGMSISHQWTYDAMARITSYIDPAGQISTYARDSLGRNIEIQYPNGFSSIKAYNGLGLTETEQLSSGVSFRYHYDHANRLSSIVNSSSPGTVASLPDHIFSYDGLDRIVTARIGSEKVERQYDSLSRLLKEVSSGDTISCSYDDHNGTVTKVWPDGRTEKYHFDLKDLLFKIEQTVSGTLGDNNAEIAEIVYSGNKIKTLKCNNDLTIENSFDDRKRLTDIVATASNGLEERLAMRYDAADRKRIEVISGKNPETLLHEFDAKDRLVSTKKDFPFAPTAAVSQADHEANISDATLNAASATGSESFSYSDTDERTHYTEMGTPTAAYTYDTGHRITSDGVRSYTHHPDGTMSSGGDLDFKVDALSRIVEVTRGPATICKIKYDAFGRPISIKDGTSPEKRFNYFDSVIHAEKENNIASKHISIHPNSGMPIAYHTESDRINPIFDSRYNLRTLIDASGDIKETYKYSSFGIPQIFDANNNPISTSASGIDPTFGGQVYLKESALYLSTKRLMNPYTGTFLSADAMGYADSSSLYVYARQNPVDYIDPDGELAFLAGLLIAAAVGAVVSGGLNAVRQGIAISEGSQKDWEWGQFGQAVGIGAVAGPLLVVAPELAIPMAIYGVANGARGIANGHYATGTFDIVTSVAPFGFRGVRNATFGRGSAYRGRAQMATRAERGQRLTNIGNAAGNYLRPYGRRIGVGIARTNPQGEGHVAVILDENGNMVFYERNAIRLEDRSLVSSYRALETPPEVYDPFPFMQREAPPFEYHTVRIPSRNVSRAGRAAQDRISTGHEVEPFSFENSNCSHFVADTIGNAGFSHFGTGRGAGVFNNFVSFANARSMGWAAPSLASAITQPNDQDPEKK